MTLRGRSLLRTSVFVGGITLLVVSILPPHVAGRCFGVPEGLGEDGVDSWYLQLDVRSDSGFEDFAILGFHPLATPGFDRSYDQFEIPFDFSPGSGLFELFAYFHYPENNGEFLGFPEDSPTPQRLAISTIQPRTEMVWPLQIAYLADSDTAIEISWNRSEVADLEEFDVGFHTPFAEWLNMTQVSSYTFNASLGIYNFVVDAHGGPDALAGAETPETDVLVLVASFGAYAAAIGLILALRWMRKRAG
ncbi:MAG: hypothetical protein ACE5I4_01060 [Thermoplasmata archaeon]